MTHNKRTVETYMEGFRNTDRSQILSSLTDDVEWDIPGVFRVQGKDEFNEYLVSLWLPPGKYVLRELLGSAGFFPIRGMFGAPVFTRFEMTPGTVVYFGRIEATIRQRTSDDQLRAGSLIPLIDPAVTGLTVR